MINNSFPPFTLMKTKECCGCEACANVCPVGIVEMKRDEEGFVYPCFDNDKCIACNKCIKVCPIIKEKQYNMIKDPFLIAYAGSADDSNIILNSSSGGMFTKIVEEWYNEEPCNSYIIGVVYDETYKTVYHEMIADIKKLDLIRRSKYVQSRKNNIYIKIKDLLENNKRVLFSGTPCEVAGLKSFLGKEYVRLFTIDIICQGPTSPIVLEQYIEKLEKKYKSKVTDLNMRYKEGVWIPQYLKVKFESGREFKDLFYDSEIGYALHIMQRPSCYSCQFIGKHKKSDITLGDFHGADKRADYYNEMGTSVVIVNTKAGYKAIEKFENRILKRVTYEEIAEKNIRLIQTWNPEPEREEFSRLLCEKGLFVASKRTRKESIIVSMRKKMPIFLKVKLLKWKQKRNRNVSM